jgi:DNA modification methylase
MNVLDEAHGRDWTLYNADCVDVCSQLPDNSIDFSVYSPPFSSLYIYSESAADMGNVADDRGILRALPLPRSREAARSPGRAG